MIRRITSLCVCAALSWGLAAAASDSFNKLRYRGGTVAAKVNPFDWNTTLTVDADGLTLDFGTRQVTVLRISQIVAVVHGPGAQRRVEEVAGAGAISKPPGLFGLVRAPRDNIIGIVYRTAGDGGKMGAVLLECDKRALWGLLNMLATVTGKRVELSP
jgi:hypothetical protein